MTHLFAHSGQNVNDPVSHLRRELSAGSCYLSAMKLRLKQIRQEKAWTVQQLADAVNLSKSHVSDIENGKKQANGYRLERFAAALGVSVYDLIDDGSMSEDERTLLLDFSSIKSDELRQTLLNTARAFREQSPKDA